MKALKRTMAGEYSRELGVSKCSLASTGLPGLDSNKGACRDTA
jgi:hypothetical protein